MHSRHRGRMLRRVSLILGAAVVASTLAACAGGTGGGSSADHYTDADIEAALQEKTEITVWTWSASLPDVAKAFEEKYPEITVNVENVGTGGDHYNKLQNAIKAGKGAPDLATIEYTVVPQFAPSGALVDLSEFGFDAYEDQFTPATWQNVNVDDKLYELPLNAGPMAMFYNQATFDKYGIEVPTTWDEYLEAARKIHAADPNAYIGADTGNSGLTESLIQAAGGHPFTVDGSDISIDLADEGTQKFTGFYQQMLDEGLLSPVSGWSPEWYAGLTDGSIATLLSGAWMAGTLKSGAPDAAGDWRVAPLPTFDGETGSATNGGGSLAVMDQGKHQLVAAAFARFATLEEGADIALKSGSFPARSSVLESDDFLNTKDDYFGGQEVNKVFTDSLDAVNTDWQFLPYELYAGTIFNDTVGPAFVGEITLADGLLAWQDALLEYGAEQGFTVEK
ncbi:ABC transporter substrate-binding protein [Agromyces aureus]|uniref:Sugar ABC transporter substrate-binding protein n=1 Tax=Agromyces aureus TaxID=453304 RepID=A0A191WIJ9_9MICO|nr:sugar ABC transporter substrate-binding protein [Agromyces aureus]ANJ28140.1 sugar ABC transporter substrate-binding protein [Agromyces aureus]